MRIALDPYMLRTVPLPDLPARVRDLGYDAIEQSLRPDLIPFYEHPRIGSSGVRAYRAAVAAAGVDIVSVLCLFRWSSPDEAERQAAMRYWKRAIAIAVELGCRRMNTEFSGRPERSAASEAQFWRSIEELLPVLEREGVDLAIEPHPDDFVEDGNAAVDIIRAIDSPRVSYLYCAPHTFHMGGDITGMLRYAGGLLTQVHLADCLDHRASSGLRYIVNPPGSTVRVHQHLDIGQGEVDFDALFAGLATIGFDGIVTTSVFAWEERADDSARVNRRAIDDLLARHFARPVA
jgi:myo-inositol catabolism protein IolH